MVSSEGTCQAWFKYKRLGKSISASEDAVAKPSQEARL
jgi:hypothetical protein